MGPAFLMLAGMTFIGAVGAVGLRNPVHCALSLVVTFAGLAGVYLGLGAQFLGLAQVLVYVGAVAILLVFVLLVTRSGGEGEGGDSWGGAVLAAGALSLLMAYGLFGARAPLPREPGPSLLGVRDLGEALMGDYVVPLQTAGALLTVALVGAAILALREGRGGSQGRGRGGRE